MRKSVIIAVTCITWFFFIPVSYSAQDTSTDKSSDEYNEPNELGIKKGTEVYGEDISKLSKEELQYIPEGWRDGEFESEHPEAEGAESKIHLQSTYPKVNSYISSNHLPQAKVEYNYISKLPKINYRYSRPEGVVAHETANSSSTIFGEISYMASNYKNAFVHAFVDDSNVIEIHPTNYIAWGAGRFANERFIHVELVRVHSFDKFARSINNYANYIATLLYQYDLGVTSAESSGKGTLWSHKAVSNYLGGTTHIDPHGYFAQWGYSWAEFVDLVADKYNNMGIKKQTTSKLGQIESASTPIYEDPVNQAKYQQAGQAHTNKSYYIKQQATLDGQTYYLISDQPSSKKGTIGWVKSQDIKVYSHTGVDHERKLMRMTGSGAAYDRAWGGTDRLVFPKLSDMAGDILDVNLTEKVGDNVWYRGYLHGKLVWIHEAHLETVSDTVFTDVPVNSDHLDAIYKMVNMGGITGYSLQDGSHEYHPVEKLSRSHAALIFARVRNLPIPTNKDAVLANFKDIDSSHLYADEIAANYQAGIFQGKDGLFMDGPLTREQMAAVIVRAFDLEDTGRVTGVKLSNVSPTHRSNVKILAQYGITTELDNFRPQDYVTRGQFASFVYRAVQQ